MLVQSCVLCAERGTRLVRSGHQGRHTQPNSEFGRHLGKVTRGPRTFRLSKNEVVLTIRSPPPPKKTRRMLQITDNIRGGYGEF